MFEEHLSRLKDNGLLRSLRALESTHGVRAVIGGSECTLFCSNDYLGLAGHAEVKAAALEAIREWGSGSGSAPLICGYTRHHERLEAELAKFKGAEKALLFGSGYLANIGIIPALAGEGDAIFSDSLNHASIIDGCRLSKAEVHIYRHCDMDSLEDALKSAKRLKRRLIITEGVFSMDGDIAPMPEILALAEKYRATILLDDAHATGVMGDTGRGTLERFGLPTGNVIQMGTLGKALGSYGAFVAADNDTIDYLLNTTRSFMFSTALPPAACAAALAALKIVKEEPERRRRLMESSEVLRSSLKAKGFDVLGGGTPIAPVLIGGAEGAARLSARLLEAGFYTPAIRPPTVPEGASRIRLTVSALHTEEDIEGLVRAMSR